MKQDRFDRNRTLYLEDEKAEDWNRTELWFSLFYALRAVAPDALRDLGHLKTEEWLRRCHLDGCAGDWLWKQAESTREVWTANAQFGNGKLWKDLDPGVSGFSGQAVHEPEPIVLRWVPQSEPRAVFQRRSKQALKEYEQQILESRDWTQPKTNRNLERDLRWLVRFQVLGQTWPEIATSHNRWSEVNEPQTDAVTVDGVRMAVYRLAEEMGLRLSAEELPNK